MPWTAVLGFSCFLAWTSLSVASLDTALNYAHALPVCMGFLAGVAAGLGVFMRGRGNLGGSALVVLCVAAAMANAIALARPPEPTWAGLLAFSNFVAGTLVYYWAGKLVSIDKEHVVPMVALAGLAASLALLLPVFGVGAIPAGLAAAPLLSAVFMRLSHMAANGAGHEGGNVSEPGTAPVRVVTARKDSQHTVWPLPCAILVCAVMSSLYTTLFAYPFFVSLGDSSLFGAGFGIIVFAALSVWSIVARRRNVNAFLILAVFMLEASLLAFSTGLIERVYVPLFLIAATNFVLAVLLWVLATLLARSEHMAVPYPAVYALFVGGGTGFLGHGGGCLISSFFAMPFAGLQVVGAVLMAGFGVILAVFFSVELIVVRSNMEARHAHEVASVRDEATHQVEAIRTQTARQITTIRIEAEQQVMTAQEEAMKRVSEIQEQASDRVKMSIRETCAMIGDQMNLTAREREVTELTCDGMSRAEIADMWLVSPNTVKYHLKNVYAKLGVGNSRELVAFVEESRVDLRIRL